MRAAVVALGCPKNRVDSEYLLGVLAQSGYELTFFPEEANLVVLTTCAFIKPAVIESEKTIRRLIALKRKNPAMKLVIAGCLFQRYKKTLPSRFPEVDHWVGLKDLLKIPQIVNNQPSPFDFPAPLPRLLSTPTHYAYLKIADGCNNNCRYCLIPKIRGPYRSRPIEELLIEAERLAQSGVKELILVAQDTTLYGTDIYQRPLLNRLIEKLSAIKKIQWIRLMYTHPKHLTPAVIEQFGFNPKLCRYIDLPIQHINDKILARMNRGYSRKEVERLIERLRAIPEMRIRTTVITGFPGETQDQFNELLNFIKQTQFDRLSGYTFFPETGTQASRMKNQVKPQTARFRLRQILHTQGQISKNKLRQLIGKDISVLVDFPGIGRTEWDAPEIDGIVKIKNGATPLGEYLNVRILDASTHDLIASPLK